jgi:hypothetical protein
VTAALAQASLAVALVVAPGVGSPAPANGALDLTDGVHLLASHEVAPVPAAATDGSAVRLRTTALATGATITEDGSAAEPPTVDAPWADTEVGPLIVDDRPPGESDTQRLDVEDDADVLSLELEIQFDSEAPDVLAEAPVQIGGAA